MQTPRTPGQQYTGRFAVLDDVARFGREQAIDLLRRDGTLGLFGHTRAVVKDFSSALEASGLQAQAHVWQLYHATLAEALASTAAILQATDTQYADIAIQPDWGAELTQQSRALMQQCGVMPADEQTLRGQVVPGLLAISRNSDGQITGTGNLLWGHCEQGPWKGYAHLGMGSVDPSARQRALGARMSAALVQAAAGHANTAGFTAASAGDNQASVRLLRSCGFQMDAQRVCVMFTIDGTRRTR